MCLGEGLLKIMKNQRCWSNIISFEEYVLNAYHPCGMRDAIAHTNMTHRHHTDFDNITFCERFQVCLRTYTIMTCPVAPQVMLFASPSRFKLDVSTSNPVFFVEVPH